jgi:hypothetical protein
VDIGVNTSLGTVNGSASASGSLFSNVETGAIQVDWGAPSWDNQIQLPAGGMAVSLNDMGSASGEATFDLFGFIPITFDVDVNVRDLGIGLGSTYSATPNPSDPAPPGAGSWNSFDFVTLLLASEFDVDISFLGIGTTIGPEDVGPEPVGGIPLVTSLSRLGGNPGNGSQIELPLPTGLSLSFGPLPSRRIPVPGCEVDASIGCASDLESVDLRLTNFTLSNLAGQIVGTQVVEAIPEPSTLALLGLGTAVLAWGVRRRR